MKTFGGHNYFVYILTNKNKTVLYTGVTNDLKVRLYQHKNNQDGFAFTHKYKCFYLLYYERFENINQAIDREKEVKGWKRSKKDDLITNFNPQWEFLNHIVESEW